MRPFASPRALALRIGAVAVLLVLALIALLVRENAARASGQEVRLAMEAFDPRSLLSGHYAALQMVQRLPVGAECPPDLEAHYSGDESWVALTALPDGTHLVSGGGASRAQALKHGALVVRGEANCRQDITPPGPPPPDAAAGTAPNPVAETRQTIVTLDIGIDRFYADQAQAEALEDSLRDQGQAGAPPAFAIVSIGRDGRGRLKGVEVGGTRADLNWF
jgi:hypothetical protein